MAHRCAACLIALLLGASAAGYAQWPQWRGPARDGSATPVAPGRWPEKLILLWNRDVGEGYAGPVVEGDRVWLHTRRGNDEVVSCLKLSSGDTLWSARYQAPFRQDDSALAHGRGPYATPALAGGRLFTFGISGVLSAWDAATGRLLWRKSSEDSFHPSFPYFGAAGSPLVRGDLIYVHFGGHYRAGPERPGVGAVVALRVEDGSEKWRWSGEAPAVGASPVICEFEGRRQLIYKTQKLIAGIDPDTGREQWRFRYPVEQDNTIVTPLCLDGFLVTSDYSAGVKAWRIESRGRPWNARLLWSHREVSLFNSSPVVAGGLVVGFSHMRKGQLFLLDPQDGKVLWRGDPRGGEHATLISRGSEVMAFLDDGTLFVGEVAQRTMRVVQRYSLGMNFAWTHAAIAGDRIVCKAGGRVYVYR